MSQIRRIRVYLIRPSRYDEEGYVVRYWRGVLPSNTLSCLYGLTEDLRERRALGDLRWRIELIDDSVQRVDVRKILRAGRRGDTKVIVALVGVQSNQFARATDLALQLSGGGAKVLIGGFHVSGSLAMQPDGTPEIERLLASGVTVVAGEIEGRWESILRDALQGRLKPVYNFLRQPPDLAAAPMPRINRRYLQRFVAPNFGTLDCGRGCPFDCSFCTVINVQGRTMRLRDVRRLTETIRENYLRRHISYYFFTDDNFCRNPHWEAICDALIRFQREEGIYIKFMAQVDTQSYRVPRFVEKLHAAGCSQVFIGLESLNPRNLESAGKRQNMVGRFRTMIETYHQAEISTHVAYIIGFPFDTPASVADDIKQLTSEVRPDQASFFMLTPLPGSRDHISLMQRGVPMDPDLNQYDSCHVTTSHSNLSSDEWRRAYDEAWKSFYSTENMKAILRRVSRERYWGVFSIFVWYKNSIVVEGGHPMMQGFFRMRHRLDRRPGYAPEGQWRHMRRRIGDLLHYARQWTRLALEMEEVWLQTRPRSDLERLIIEEINRRHAHINRWRELRLSELHYLYRRAAARLRSASAQIPKWNGVTIPSQARLWVMRRNLFAHALTDSRRSFKRFWRRTWMQFRRGRWDRVDVGRITVNLAEEGLLFGCFAGAYFGHLLPHLFGRVAAHTEMK